MKQKRIWDISYYISENNHNRQGKTVDTLMDDYTTLKERNGSRFLLRNDLQQKRKL